MKTFTYLIAFLVSTTVIAQNQEFSDTIDALNNELKTVESGKHKYSQKILVNQPGIVSLEIYRITLKDSKSRIMNYEFNFADIDINTVRTSLEKDLINVQLLADKNQKLLRVTENKEKIYFTNEIFLQATDVENGKALEESIKTAIQLAKKIIRNRLSLNTYGEHMDWLSSNIKDVSLIKNQYTQSMAGLGDYPGKIEYRVSENNDKSSKNEVFQFNTSTLNPNSLLLTIEGELLSVYMETSRKLKTIKYFREGQQQNYTSNIKVIFESV